MDNNKIYVVYSYYEKNDIYKLNLQYFCKYGYLPEVFYIFVINGLCSFDIPKCDNIVVLYRENIGFDFQGYYTGIKYIMDNETVQITDYIIFMNCTIRGPFIPNYCNIKWYIPFVNLHTEKSRLIGCTINCHPSPHVQSYLLLMNYECVVYLVNEHFFDIIYKKIHDVILNQEIRLSTIILNNNWDINCIVKEYSNLDYNNILSKPKFDAWKLHPYELIFAKSSWGDPTGDVKGLTQRFFDLIYINQKTLIDDIPIKCVKYGINRKNTIDITKKFYDNIFTNINTLNPNKWMGDPYCGIKKKLYFFPKYSSKTINIKETCNKFIVEKKYEYNVDIINNNLYLKKYFIQKI
jgi:hypothetical protein